MAESGKLLDIQDITNTQDVRVARAVYRAFGASQGQTANAGTEAEFNMTRTLTSNGAITLFDTSDGATNEDGNTPDHYEIEYASLNGAAYGPALVQVYFQGPDPLSGTDITVADADPDTFTSASQISAFNSTLAVGDVVRVLSSTGNNDGFYRVGALSGGVLTVESADTLTAEASGPTFAFVPVQSVITAGVTGGTGGSTNNLSPTPFHAELDLRDLGRWGVRSALKDRLPGRGHTAESGKNYGIVFETEGLGHGPGIAASTTADYFDLVVVARPVYV